MSNQSISLKPIVGSLGLAEAFIYGLFSGLVFASNYNTFNAHGNG